MNALCPALSARAGACSKARAAPAARLAARSPSQLGASRPAMRACATRRAMTIRAGNGGPGPCLAAEANTREYKAALVYRLLKAKEESGKSFNDIASEIGLTNANTAQLFHNQARLSDATAVKLQAAVPTLDDETIAVMKRAPMRMYNPDILMEPNVYRTHEAVMHYGDSIKALVNEQLGDGIMSAIDFFLTVDTVKGKGGEDRIVITMNGKFLPYLEQVAEDNTAL